MTRRTGAVGAVVLGAGLALIPATPAGAIGGGPNTLTVIAYYSDGGKQTLVGQKWLGCSGPGGQWGVTTPHINLFFPPCQTIACSSRTRSPELRPRSCFRIRIPLRRPTCRSPPGQLPRCHRHTGPHA